MRQAAVIGLVAAGLLALASGAALERMYSEKTSTADLETSASGYMYQSASGYPTSYVHISRGAPVAQYYVPHVVQAAQPVVAAVEDKATDEDKGDDEDVAAFEHYEAADDGAEDGAAYGSYEADGGHGDYGSNEGGYGGGSGFEQTGGEKYDATKHSAHGEKGDKAYANKHGYSKGVKGQHGKEHDEGYYKEAAGKKAGHHESGGHYGKHNEEEQKSKGAKYGESKHHKKGQKTTGFHNVYHKDEYKKDHTFYDEADNGGSYEKHGSFSKHHAAAEGAHKKGGKSAAGYHDDKYGKGGSHAKGHYDESDAGFSGKNGHEAHHSSYADYARAGGHKDGAEYGSADGGHGDEY